jgi:tripartite-type tricarboxylate transporter receptor subunit TctC
MPGLQMVQWYAVVAPAATPKEIVARLNAEMNRALAAPEVKDRLIGAGLTPKGSTVEEFAAIIRSDYERYQKVVRDSGAKPGL